MANSAHFVTLDGSMIGVVIAPTSISAQKINTAVQGAFKEWFSHPVGFDQQAGINDYLRRVGYTTAIYYDYRSTTNHVIALPGKGVYHYTSGA